MYHKSFSIRLFLLVLLIFLLNYLALKFYWYSSIWYLDMLMHFLGGFWIGMLIIWLFKPEKLNFKLIIEIILGVLFIGVLWEFFEVSINEIITNNSFNVLDTLSDLFFDIAGGLLVSFLIFKETKNSNFGEKLNKGYN